MRNVIVHRRLEINLNADDWQLYAIEGREKAAEALNAAVEAQINNALNRSEACLTVYNTLAQFSQWGADDSEGHKVADRLIELRFPYKD